MKTFLPILTLLFLSCTFSVQDWCAWSFRYDFKMSSHYYGEYWFDSLSVAFNNALSSAKFQMDVDTPLELHATPIKVISLPICLLRF